MNEGQPNEPTGRSLLAAAREIERRNGIDANPFIHTTDELYRNLNHRAALLSIMLEETPGSKTDDAIFDELETSYDEAAALAHAYATAVIEMTIKRPERVALIARLYTVTDAYQAKAHGTIKNQEPLYFTEEYLRQHIDNAYLPQNPRQFVESVSHDYAQEYQQELVSLFIARNPHVRP